MEPERPRSTVGQNEAGTSAGRFLQFISKDSASVGLLFGLLFLISFDVMNLYRKSMGLEDSVHLAWYSQLAWAFLHGRVDIPGADPRWLDMSPFQGRVYGYWPPLAAVLMAPLVAWRGAAHFPQRIFGMIFGSINVGLFYLIAERLRRQIHLLVPVWTPLLAGFFFGWGTSNFIYSIVSNHFFISPLIASSFMLTALWLVLERRPEWRRTSTWLGAVSFAVATGGRQHLILAFPLWVYLACSDERFVLRTVGKRECRRAVEMLVPVMIVLALMLWYNHLRFGRWFENGLSYHNPDSSILNDYRTYGYFNFHFIPRNIYYLLLRPPGASLVDHQPGWMGFSLFLQCPILFLAIGQSRSSEFRRLTTVLWLFVGLVSLPILMLYSTGFSQFGSRYLYDVVPLLSVLVLLRSEGRSRLFVALGLLSIAVNFLGPPYFLYSYSF